MGRQQQHKRMAEKFTQNSNQSPFQQTLDFFEKGTTSSEVIKYFSSVVRPKRYDTTPTKFRI